MHKIWSDTVDEFLELTDRYQVRMIMVGGGAVNFHGYQRHSADVDFWIDISNQNLEKLKIVLNEMGFIINEFPQPVYRQQQNISIKFSPTDLNVELITRFEIGKTFQEAFDECELVEIKGRNVFKWRVLNLEDLITSKKRAARPKDLLDIEELKRRNKIK